MAQTPILLAFEPWLKPINYWSLSHGSNPQKMTLWAMAQTHQLLNFEPWLKPQKMTLWAMAQTHIWHADFLMIRLEKKCWGLGEGRIYLKL